MADVRDLLIRMTLDTSTFKTNIADAKRELKTLKSEYRAISASDDIGQGGEKLLSNLREQKTAAEALVKEYQTGIEEIRAKLNTVPAGSQAASQLQSQVQTLENGMARAQEQVEILQNQINGIRLDTFITHAETVASMLSSLRLGLGEVFDAAGRAADSADTANVSREAARISGTKSFEGATNEQLKALDDTVKRMITTELPLLYQQMYGILEVAGQQGIDILDAPAFSAVMAKLSVATDMTADTGSKTMAQFINLTEKSYDHISNVGSALVSLGNNAATSESQILEMAHRAASGLSQVGMSSADILGVSAAISSMGIESQAGGTAISKLAKQMDEAAKVGAGQIPRLLGAWGDDSIKSVTELYALLDSMPNAKGWKLLGPMLGEDVTGADAKKMMNAALAAERFSQAMGMTVDQFSSGWNENAADQLLNFFTALGSMGGTDIEDNMLWTMDKLGITEVRTSNMVRSLSNNWQLYADMIELANKAYAENIAMDEEANRAFSTNESRRVINQNKEQNALEKMGQTVTEMRKPWEDFFADLQQWYADWPGWAQTAVGAAAEGAKNLGGLLEGAGKAAFSILSISKAIKEIEQSTLGAALLKRLAAAGGAVAAGAATTVLPGALLIGGAIYSGIEGNRRYTEETFGESNAAIERTGELLDTAGGKMSRLQELFQAFAAATQDEDYVPKIQAAWAQYGDELLALFPELKTDLHDNMDGMDWEILGSDAVTRLASGIDAEKQGLYDSGYAAGLDMQAGVAQGIYDGLDDTLAAAGYAAGQIEEALFAGLNGYAASTGGQSVPAAGGAQRGQNASPQPQTAQITINMDGKTVAQSLAPIVDQVMGDAMWQ